MVALQSICCLASDRSGDGWSRVGSTGASTAFKELPCHRRIAMPGKTWAEAAWHIEILQYLSLHFAGTLAVPSNLVVPGLAVMADSFQKCGGSAWADRTYTEDRVPWLRQACCRSVEAQLGQMEHSRRTGYLGSGYLYQIHEALTLWASPFQT